MLLLRKLDESSSSMTFFGPDGGGMGGYDDPQARENADAAAQGSAAEGSWGSRDYSQADGAQDGYDYSGSTLDMAN